MKFLAEEDCREHCDFHQVCVKSGKLYRDGCVLEGEGFREGIPEDGAEREERIARLKKKLVECVNA